jgi:hypothetical protein
LQSRLGVIREQNWEESLELLLKRLGLKQLLQGLVVQLISSVWVLIVWQLSAFVGLTILVDFLVPSYKQIFDVVKELVMQLDKGPRLLDPNESWQVKQSLTFFKDVDGNLEPLQINSII